jgi:hypothetical protein
VGVEVTVAVKVVVGVAEPVGELVGVEVDVPVGVKLGVTSTVTGVLVRVKVGVAEPVGVLVAKATTTIGWVMVTGAAGVLLLEQPVKRNWPARTERIPAAPHFAMVFMLGF